MQKILIKLKRFIKYSRLFKCARFGIFYRNKPISAVYGLDRGRPIDRFYSERFLNEHRGDVRGVVLEFGDRHYTKCFGQNRVAVSDIINIIPSPDVTFVADLRDGPALPQEKYDCIICTQVLQYLDDLDTAVANLYKMLKTDGVLLCTLPAISRMDPEWKDMWHFTKHSASYIFGRHFSEKHTEVESWGNVFAAVSFLEGLCVEDIGDNELKYNDEKYPVNICVRAVRVGGRDGIIEK